MLFKKFDDLLYSLKFFINVEFNLNLINFINGNIFVIDICIRFLFFKNVYFIYEILVYLLNRLFKRFR